MSEPDVRLFALTPDGRIETMADRCRRLEAALAAAHARLIWTWSAGVDICIDLTGRHIGYVSSYGWPVAGVNAFIAHPDGEHEHWLSVGGFPLPPDAGTEADTLPVAKAAVEKAWRGRVQG